MSRGRRAAGVVVALAAVMTASSCSGAEQHGTLSSRVAAWVRGVDLKSSVSTLRDDDARIDRVVAAKDPGAIRTDCAVLLTDDGSANQNLPAPVDQLTNALTSAYQAEQNAANDCYNGANGGPHGALLRKSAVERAAARSDLTSAVSLVQQLSGVKVG